MNRFDPSTAAIVGELSHTPEPTADLLARRRFLQVAAAAGGVAMVPTWMTDMAGAATPLGANDGVLVLVMMHGGNDGMSMVPPYNDGHYRDLRGGLAISGAAALKIDGERGFHPNLGFVKSKWDQGQVAIIDGVGHPDPDLSHFVSTARWMTGSTRSNVGGTGWLGRYTDGLGAGEFASITLGSSVPLTQAGVTTSAIALPSSSSGLLDINPDPVYARQRAAISAMNANRTDLHSLGRQLADSTGGALDLASDVQRYYRGALPESELAAKLALCARLINANVGARVLVVGYGDFDSHAGQNYQHGERMREFDDAMRAFYSELSDSFAGRTLVLTSSEFGRRPNANQSGGTDHGTSSTLLAIGSGVKGGFYGQRPTFAGLRTWDNFAFHVDYRHVYANVVDRWLGGDAGQVIGSNFGDLGFLGTPTAGPGGVVHSVSGQPGGARLDVARLYLAYFGRLPDDAGMEFWIGQRRAGMSLDAISSEFARSAEFVATYGQLDSGGFTDLIYRNVLRRDPDQAGRDYWVGLLDGGAERGSVMTGFSQSTEFVNLTDAELLAAEMVGPIGRLYRAYFVRTPDEAGLRYWMGTPTALADISAEFAASAEFVGRYGSLDNRGFLHLVYQNVMGRTADQAGLEFWLDVLDAGATRGAVMLEFSNSAEFVTLVKSLGS